MGAEGSSMIIMIVLMFAIMYFLMIRPENKRKKKAQEMRDGLKKGDTCLLYTSPSPRDS